VKDAHLTLRLPDELARALERAAEERGVAKSMLVREAVSQYLAGGPSKPAKPSMTLEEFIEKWESLPTLTPEEAEEYARNIEQARAELLPLRDPWE
jgi:predicted transcriptional regulator